MRSLGCVHMHIDIWSAAWNVEDLDADIYHLKMVTIYISSKTSSCTSNSFAFFPSLSALWICNVGTPGCHVSVDRLRQSIRFDYPFYHRYGATFIGMIVAAVYVCYTLVSTCDSDQVSAVCMEVHGGIAVPYEFDLIRPISSYLRPGLVLLHSSKWRLVHQTFGKEFNPDFLPIVILSNVKVTAVILFDTVHQALITHTGGFILQHYCLDLNSCTVLTWRL